MTGEPPRGRVGARPRPAHAAHLGADDPLDGEATVSGQPSAPDVSRLDVDYDPAGTITLTVRFHGPLDQVDTSQNYAFYSTFTVGHAERGTTPGGQRGHNCTTAAQGDLNGQHHVLTRHNFTFYDQAAVTGYDGLLQFSRTTAPDGRSIAITASSPVLAGRSYTCATYALRGRRRGPAENLNTRYDESCDCWYFSRDYDVVGQPRSGTDTSPPLYFDGQAPPPLPACDDGIDNDGDRRTDASGDPGCARDTEGATEAEACRNAADDDGDGRVDLADPGCVDDPDRMSEADPAPRASRTSASARVVRRCGVRVDVAVSPDVEPVRLIPYGKAEVRVLGVSGRARGLSRRRTVALDAEEGTGETGCRGLRPGRYAVRVTYLGDRWRLPSRSRARALTLKARHCARARR